MHNTDKYALAINIDNKQTMAFQIPHLYEVTSRLLCYLSSTHTSQFLLELLHEGKNKVCLCMLIK